MANPAKSTRYASLGQTVLGKIVLTISEDLFKRCGYQTDLNQAEDTSPARVLRLFRIPRQAQTTNKREKRRKTSRTHELLGNHRAHRRHAQKPCRRSDRCRRR